MIGVQDKYGTVYNSKKTYKYLAGYVRYCPIFVAWTDQEGTQLDLLLVVKPDIMGIVQGGLHDADLLVAVMRKGAFGFDVNNLETHPAYVAEKLGIDNDNTCKKLTEFINGVRHYLYDVGTFGVK